MHKVSRPLIILRSMLYEFVFFCKFTRRFPQSILKKGATEVVVSRVVLTRGLFGFSKIEHANIACCT